MKYRRFPKLTLLVDIDTHMVLSMLRGQGPPPDIQELIPLLDDIPKGMTVALSIVHRTLMQMKIALKKSR